MKILVAHTSGFAKVCLVNDLTTSNTTPVIRGSATAGTAIFILPITSTVEASALDRDMAHAAFSRHTSFVSACDYLDAAKVMRKTLSPETIIRLNALHCVDYGKLPASVTQWIAELVEVIIS